MEWNSNLSPPNEVLGEYQLEFLFPPEKGESARCEGACASIHVLC